MNNDPLMKHTPEKVILDDNARKFTCKPFDPSEISKGDLTSFVLITDWLEAGEDNEKKLAYKKFDNGAVQILLIEKVTKDGRRTSQKQEITNELYDELVLSAVLHLEKSRHEFTYEQNGIEFTLRYDDFGEENPRVLEVDAANESDRGTFDPNDFPVALAEVTGDTSYYGYRMAEHVSYDGSTSRVTSL